MVHLYFHQSVNKGPFSGRPSVARYKLRTVTYIEHGRYKKWAQKLYWENQMVKSYVGEVQMQVFNFMVVI